MALALQIYTKIGNFTISAKSVFNSLVLAVGRFGKFIQPATPDNSGVFLCLNTSL